jgi:CheY-like chemotaxis protein
MATILYVDDITMDGDITEHYKWAMKELGHTPLYASNGKEALEIIREQRGGIDLLLLDLNMPVMNGYSVLRELAREEIQIPTVLCSMAGEPEEVKEKTGYHHIIGSESIVDYLGMDKWFSNGTE